MLQAERQFDLLAMGRSSIDLYANDIGAPFVEIKSFAAYVGGSPTNIAVGARRLGLRAALLTAVGDDPVGDFILHFLNQEGVETKYIPRKAGYRTSAVLLGIQPPDRFPLVFYRAEAADIQLTIEDVLAAPVTDSRVLEISGTNLSREPSRSATLVAAEIARGAGTTVVLDLDLRPDQWHDARAYGAAIRSLLPLVDIAIGNPEEVRTSAPKGAGGATAAHSPGSNSGLADDLVGAVEALLRLGPRALVVKRGAAGAAVFLPEGEPVHAPGFPVEVYNVLGAGDAFAAGLIYGYLVGWDWYRAARMGNALGAIIVTRHGCANFMPSAGEALEFIAQRGGF